MAWLENALQVCKGALIDTSDADEADHDWVAHNLEYLNKFCQDMMTQTAQDHVSHAMHTFPRIWSSYVSRIGDLYTSES